MSIKINGLKEPPKWYRYVEPGEEPDPRALLLDEESHEWMPRSFEKEIPYATWNIYAVPIYGPIPDGYELVEDDNAVASEGEMFWSSAEEWLKSANTPGSTMYTRSFPYIRPIKPTPAERPLLTAADFMKNGPWWLRFKGVEVYTTIRTMDRHEAFLGDGKRMTWQELRDQCERSNDGEHWEDC